MTRNHHFALRRFGASALFGAVALLAGPALAANAASAPGAKYQKERADCEAGRTAQDRATCLREAGAAAQERKRDGLQNTGNPQGNALDRCNNLPAKDKTDCIARAQNAPVVPNQKVTTSGSVAGGGVLKETTTTTPGQTIIIPLPAASGPTK